MWEFGENLNIYGLSSLSFILHRKNGFNMAKNYYGLRCDTSIYILYTVKS